MKKYLIFFGIPAVLLLLFFSFYSAVKISSGHRDPNAPTLELPSTQGPPVTVNNFLKSPAQNLSYGAVIVETADYKIIYFSEDEGIIITLKSTPLGYAQVEAEGELLVKLGISRTQACNLKVFITVPMDVSAEAAGKSYPMSFCTGGKVL